MRRGFTGNLSNYNYKQYKWCILRVNMNNNDEINRKINSLKNIWILHKWKSFGYNEDVITLWNLIKHLEDNKYQTC